MSETDNQFRALIDRILRSREAEDEAKLDTKEIYAEAKSSGYDKTAMGQLVAHLRKVEKVGKDAVDERETVFGLYLDAYQRATGTRVATHTHEKSPGDGQRAAESPRFESVHGPREGHRPATYGQLVTAGETAPIPQSSAPTSSPAETKATGTTPLVPVATPFKLRPKCLNPDRCGGYGTKHCFGCLKADASATLQHGALA